MPMLLVHGPHLEWQEFSMCPFTQAHSKKGKKGILHPLLPPFNTGIFIFQCGLESSENVLKHKLLGLTPKMFTQ